MNAMDLNSPATAFWLLDPQRDRKSFDSLREAVQFVMELLEEQFRGRLSSALAMEASTI
jgi:hypothetical protein